MITTSLLYQYKPYEYMKEGNFENTEDFQPRSFEELQAKISELEIELRKQKETADKNSKILKFIWGDQFETDSLH